MSKIARIISLALVAVSLVALVVVNAFALPGQRNPVEKVIPSATAVITKSNGITQTPSAFAGNPYSTTWLYRAGNADSSVLLTVYTDDGYTDSSGIWTGVKSLHYVFTSKWIFDFNIDFGNVPDRLFDYYINGDNVDFPTAMAFSVRAGMATSINSNGLPAGLSTAENLTTEVYLNTSSIDGQEYYSPNAYTGVGSYEHIEYDASDTGLVINSIAGHVSFDFGNNYQFVDVRICIQADNDEYGHFIPGITSCDVLNKNYLNWLQSYSTDGGYEKGYSNGYDTGYFVGYDEGSEYGYDVGYDTGYGAGVEDGVENAVEEMGFFSFFINSIEAFLSFPLFPLPEGGAITLGMLIGVIVGAMAFVWLLKLIAGG